MNIDNCCPNCKNSFELSKDDVYIKLTISIEGKTYRVYNYKKICPSCNQLLFMKTGMPDYDNNGKWVVSEQQENK